MIARVAILVINRDRPDLTDQVVGQLEQMGNTNGIEKKIYVVECGSSAAGTSKSKTHSFRDARYRGRYYGFNRALGIARKDGKWDYYWFVVNDITFNDGEDALAELVAVMQQNPRMALIGPAEPEARNYRGCHPRRGRRWHKASTVCGLAWLMRATAIDEVGYCNPAFRYSQGASTELAYKLYRANWFLAYSDTVSITHAGGSTYGKVVKISRHEYHRRARDFASRYLRENYGDDWDDLFTSVLPDDIETNTFPWLRSVFDHQLKPERRHLWFWKTGSWIKQNIFRIRPREMA